MAFRHLLRKSLLDQIPSGGFPSSARFLSSAATLGEPIRATLFPGDGIGPEIAESVKQVCFKRIVYDLFCLFHFKIFKWSISASLFCFIARES